MKIIMIDQKCLSDAIISILSSREPRLFDDRGPTSCILSDRKPRNENEPNINNDVIMG